MTLRYNLVSALFLAASLFVVSGQGISAAHAQDAPPTVFAAASLKDALDGVNEAWQKEKGEPAKISYAATSALAKQIAQGAPADIFFSADLDWMDYVAKTGRLKPGTRSNLLANHLVLIAPKDSDVEGEIAPGFDLKEMLHGGKLAMANVDAVPAGKYGKAALRSLKVWDSVKGSIAQAQNVRVALALVARGEAPLGIVYRTDALAESRVRIVGTFPEGSHPAIIYPVAQLKDASSSLTTEFLTFLHGGRARAIFEAEGFAVLDDQ